MNKVWKNWVELCVGVIGSVVVGLSFVYNVKSADWFWAIIAFIALFFYIGLLANAWRKI